ncbi:MAG: hypothetical protein ACR2MP_19600 [Streptosporangiaceae bacterium]
MRSHWDLGRRPTNPSGEAAYREVSTFNTAEAAASKARLLGLGEFVAELEVPDTVVMKIKAATGHVGLSGTDPAQLLGYVQDVQSVHDVLD